MIHARDDYNRIQDPAGKIPEDEPVFLLRAQDQLACMAVAYYASLCEQAQSPEIAAKAREHADRMAAWPVKKVPDLPAQEATLSQGTRQAEPVALSTLKDERAKLARIEAHFGLTEAQARSIVEGAHGPIAASAPALQPDGYLEHTPMGDFLAYSATTKNRQTALYSLEKARAILASPTHERAAPAPEINKESDNA